MPAYALVLTGPDIPDGLVHTVTQRLVDWLAPTPAPALDVLCERKATQWRFELDAERVPQLLATVRDVCEPCKVDANIVPDRTQRRKRLLIADMDSTIIEQECIDEIATVAGVGAEVAAITERAMRGELDFEEALTVRVGLLKGLPVGVLERVASEHLTITPGAQTVVATMAHAGAHCALISGGFTFFTSRIAANVGFHENRANTLQIENGHLTGHPAHPILGQQAKLDALTAMIESRSLAFEDALAVGDGANDLAMIEAAGLGVAYHAKPVVAAKADAQLAFSDLSALLYLQGYHRHEFIC